MWAIEASKRSVHPVRRALAVVGLLSGLLALVVVVPATPAGAHAELVTTDPAHGEVLEAAPSQVVLQFSEQVDPPSDGIEILDSAGDAVPVDSVAVSGNDIVAELPELEDDAYVVSWQVTSADSHPISGAFLFYVGEPADDGSADELLAEVRQGGGADRSLGVVYGVARFALFAGLVLLVGGALFVALLWPAGAVNARLRRLVGLGWLVVLLATVASFGLQAAYGAGGSWADTIDGGHLGDVLGGRTGRTWLVRLGLLALVPLAWRTLFPPWWFFPLARRRSRTAPAGGSATETTAPQPVLVLVLGGLLLATVSFAGHAASGPYVAAALVADVVHLSAGVFWLAGLALLLLVVLRAGATGRIGSQPESGDTAQDLVSRFSSLAFVAVVTIVVTGTFQGWRQVETVDALTDATYGRLLLAKVALFTVILAAAALSRQVVRRWAARSEPSSGDDEASPSRLRRSVGVEAVVAVSLLAVTSVLVNSVPGREAEAASAFETEIHGSDVAVLLTVDPAETGLADIDIRTVSHTYEPVEVEALSVTMSLEERSITRLEVAVEPAGGTGHFVASDADIPLPGLWSLEVVVRLSEMDQERLSIDVPVS